MAGWQEELAELLRELGVTQEEPKTHPRLTDRAMRSDLSSDSSMHDRSVDAFIFNDLVSTQDFMHSWQNDLDAMRREVDSIVRQVIQLMQRGDLDKSLKEDVMIVLRALRRRAAVTRQASVSEEAYLESAASMLHFCRIVLRLSETAIEDEL